MKFIAAAWVSNLLQAKKLKLCITAGVGSDHIDLNAAVDHKIQVLEVIIIYFTPRRRRRLITLTGVWL